jgi:hypothetical protein
MFRIFSVLMAFSIAGCTMTPAQKIHNEMLELGEMPPTFKAGMVMGLSWRFAPYRLTSIRYSPPRPGLWGQVSFVRVTGASSFREPLDACLRAEFVGGRLRRAILGNNFGHCDNLSEDLTPELEKYNENLEKRMKERKELKASTLPSRPRIEGDRPKP